MKKILIILISFILLTGCGMTANTPTDSVEKFLGKYQSMDSEVLAQLDNVVSGDDTMNDQQKSDYQALMEKQYQNLSYKIKDEEIDGDTATVLVEIEVYDYANSIAESREYYNEHRDEFDTDDIIGNDGSNTTDNNTVDDEGIINGGDVDNNDEDDEDNDTDLGDVVEDILDSAFIDFKIKQLKDVTDKAKYEITFHLTKEDDEWIIEDISDTDRQKLHGLYED